MPYGAHAVWTAQDWRDLRRALATVMSLRATARDDHLVRLAFVPQALREDIQVRVVIRGHKRRLVQDASQRPAAAANGPLPPSACPFGLPTKRLPREFDLFRNGTAAQSRTGTRLARKGSGAPCVRFRSVDIVRTANSRPSGIGCAAEFGSFVPQARRI